MTDPAAASLILSVSGLHCPACSARVEKALAAVPGVADAKVNLPLGEVRIGYDPARATPDALMQAIRQAGYDAAPPLPAADAGEATLADRAVARLGVDREEDGARFNLLVAWGASFLSMAPMLMGDGHAHGWGYWTWAWAAVAGFGAGRAVFGRALRLLGHGATGMDTLIALGVAASLASGVAALSGWGAADFSMVGGMIMAFHLTGRWLETRARRRATRDLAALARLGAKNATLERPDGTVATVPATALNPGDLVRVGAGDTIPRDGEVVEGAAGVDESLLTGESLPVAKHAGDEVIGGAINVDGFLRVRVTRPAGDAFLDRVTALVASAQSDKPPIQALADRITGIFVPGVILLALLAAVVQYFFGDAAVFAGVRAVIAGGFPGFDAASTPATRALSAGVATLVIACPCALGLASPMALTVGLGAAARRGILFRNGAVVQALAEADVVLLDKTGTVTEGRPVLLDYLWWTPPFRDPAAGETLDQLLRIAVALEEPSTHPVARAVVARFGPEAANAAPPPADNPPPSPVTAPVTVTAWRNEPGRGVSGRVSGRVWRIGGLSWAEECGAELPAKLAAARGDSDLSGMTTVALFDECRVRALFFLADTPRADAVEALASLRVGQGLRRQPRRLILATGDQREAAERIGRLLGFDEVEAGLLPRDKLKRVQILRAEGLRVAMVGDGVNDAPALAGADAGIALGTGSDVAREAGDVLLVREGLGGVAETFALAERIFANIRQNLGWAFFYNLLALPLAFSGLLHPLLAEAAMAASSLTVVLNALRLRRPPEKADPGTTQQA